MKQALPAGHMRGQVDWLTSHLAAVVRLRLTRSLSRSSSPTRSVRDPPRRVLFSRSALAKLVRPRGGIVRRSAFTRKPPVNYAAQGVPAVQFNTNPVMRAVLGAGYVW